MTSTSTAIQEKIPRETKPGQNDIRPTAVKSKIVPPIHTVPKATLVPARLVRPNAQHVPLTQMP